MSHGTRGPTAQRPDDWCHPRTSDTTLLFVSEPIAHRARHARLLAIERDLIDGRGFVRLRRLARPDCGAPGPADRTFGWQDVREARGLTALVDPFDRLIAGTALRLDAPLLTLDERIRRSGLVRTVW